MKYVFQNMRKNNWNIRNFNILTKTVLPWLLNHYYNNNRNYWPNNFSSSTSFMKFPIFGCRLASKIRMNATKTDSNWICAEKFLQFSSTIIDTQNWKHIEQLTLLNILDILSHVAIFKPLAVNLKCMLKILMYFSKK